MLKFWLIVNGDDEIGLSQALKRDADAVIINLYGRPYIARAIAAEFVLAQKSVKSAPLLIIRISPINHPESIGELEAVIKSAPYGIALAKCDSGMDVQQLGNRLGVLEAMNGAKVGCTKIISFIETASALLKMDSYKNASKRLEGLIFSVDDLAESMNTKINQGFSALSNTARALSLFGAKSAGILAINKVSETENKNQSVHKIDLLGIHQFDGILDN